MPSKVFLPKSSLLLWNITFSGKGQVTSKHLNIVRADHLSSHESEICPESIQPVHMKKRHLLKEIQKKETLYIEQ